MTTIPCYSCGTKKDPNVMESHDVEGSMIRHVDSTLPPLHVLDCQGRDGNHDDEWKSVIVCSDCFDRLDPDMWISIQCWESLDPHIPFKDLPDMCGSEMDWDVEKIEQERLRGKTE